MRIAELGGAQDKQTTTRQVSFSETFCDPVIRKAVYIAIFISQAQQTCGINAIMLYSGTILTDISVPPFLGTMAITIVNLLATLVAMLIGDKFGRRPMLISSYASACFFNVAAGLCMIESA